jgi:hypothetical protein
MNPIFIPIGDSCSVARQLELYDLRRFAFPFDWLRIKRLSTITKIINNKFEGFADFKQCNETTSFPFLETDDFNPDAPKRTFKATNRYGVLSFHDFSSDKPFIDQLPSIQQKYQRRIDRFYETLRSSDQIIFIRDELNPDKLTEDDVKEFIRVIKQINPNLQFSIRIVCHKSLPNIQIPTVSLIHDTNEFEIWTRPNVNWPTVFNVSTDERRSPSDE